MLINCCSTTEEDGQTTSSGCLEWWTLHKPLPWASCRWLTRGMLPHYYPSSEHTLPQEPSSTLMNGLQTEGYHRISHIYNMPLSTTLWSLTNGVHTQNIESYWNRVKKKFKTMKGVHSHQLPSYLDEFMWRERYGTSSEQAFDSIILDKYY